MRGFLYILVAEEHEGKFKVGKTSNLKQRLEKYHADIPPGSFSREYIAKWEVDDYYDLEDAVREMLMEDARFKQVGQRNSEWFMGDIETARQAIHSFLLTTCALFNPIVHEDTDEYVARKSSNPGEAYLCERDREQKRNFIQTHAIPLDRETRKWAKGKC